jgi:hypothetical protein
MADTYILHLYSFYGNHATFRVFTNVSQMKGMTASDYMVLMVILGAAIGFMADIIPDDTVRYDVQRALYSLNNVYRTLNQRIPFTEASLRALDRAIIRLQKNFITAFMYLSLTKMCFPKFHCLNHLVFFIKLFGSPRNWDTATLELFHKICAKRPWRRTNGVGDWETRNIKYVHVRCGIGQLRHIRLQQVVAKKRAALGPGFHPYFNGVFLQMISFTGPFQFVSIVLTCVH